MSEPKDKQKELTEKEEAFCQSYLIDFNGARAARDAGYSIDSARAIAAENLTKPHIRARIQQIRAEMGKAFNITRERIAQEYARLAFFDIRAIHTIDGALKQVTEFDDDSAAAIAGIEVWEEPLKSDDPDDQLTVGRLKKVKIADKRAALDSLCKLMGYNAPDKQSFTDQDGNDLPVQIIQLPHNGRNNIETKEDH